ncbi:MAG: hypothetical protein ACJAV1_003683 [Paraglaciecola sp.]|jgi:hypothetical protein
MVQFRLNLFDFSMLSIIDDSNLSAKSVSTAAFCKARMKLSYQAFIELNDDLIHTLYEAATIDKWQGHRLLVVDGSVTKLPISNKLLEHVGKTSSSKFAFSSRLYNPFWRKPPSQAPVSDLTM